jgi:hypothetical protein
VIPYILLLLVLAEAPRSPAAVPHRAEFVAAVQALPFLSADTFVYDRTNPPQASLAKREYAGAIADLRSLRIPFDELALLSADEEPRVRAMALCLLYDLEDPRAVPLFEARRNDAAIAISEPDMLASEPRIGVAIPTHPLTVGAIARMLLRAHLQAAGITYNINEAENRAKFARYWKSHEKLSAGVALFSVKLARASQGTLPTPRDRFDEIAAVRAKIDDLPKLERALTLLFLSGDNGGKELVGDDLLEITRSVGAESLLKLLEGTLVTADPDLVRERPGFGSAARFLYAHARELFRSEDADRLSALGTPEARTAAAMVDVKRARPLLHQTYDSLKPDWEDVERGQLALSLWRIAGDSEEPFALDWLYEEPAREPSVRTRAIEMFLREILEEKSPENQRMLAVVVADPRLARLPFHFHKQIILGLGKWIGKPVVTFDEIQDAFGSDVYYWDEAAARRRDPAAVERALAKVAEWRQRFIDVTTPWRYSTPR